MNKRIYRQLLLLVVIITFNQTLSAQNKFEYKLVKPTTNELTIKSNEKLLVEIQFNAEAVNQKGAYIAIFINGKMGRFSASTNMESPYTNTVKGSMLKEGNNSIEYALLPPGKMEISEALAIEKINVVLVESVFQVDEKFVQSVVKTIKENDEATLLSYCITQKALDKMTQNIKGDSPKVTEIKADLKSESVEVFRKQVLDGFNRLQQEYAEKKLNTSDMRLHTRIVKEVMLETSEFGATKVDFFILNGTNRTIVKIKVFITAEEKYLFDFDIEQL